MDATTGTTWEEVFAWADTLPITRQELRREASAGLSKLMEELGDHESGISSSDINHHLYAALLYAKRNGLGLPAVREML